MKKLRKPSLSRAWTPAKATEELRKLARQDFNFCWTTHFKEQLEARGLVVGDITHVLKNGFVYEDAEPSTRSGFFKYKMECTTPNSGRRVVRVVVIPQLKPPEFKIVTVMWVDESTRK